MSSRFCIIPAYALEDERLTKTDLKVLNSLGSHADTKGWWCYPSQQTIADQVKVTRMSVSRSIKKLCDCGYIISRPKFRADGSQSSNAYKILFDKEWPETAGDTPCNNDVTPPATEMLHPCNSDVEGGVTPGCYTNERPTLKKKEITKVISKKEKLPFMAVHVSHVEEWARENIPPSIKLAWELGKFKDYWSDTKRKPPGDGVIAFRKWLRKATEYQEQARQTAKGTGKHKDFHTQDYYAGTDGFVTE